MEDVHTQTTVNSRIHFKSFSSSSSCSSLDDQPSSSSERSHNKSLRLPSARTLKRKASRMIIQVPVKHFKKLKNEDNIGPFEREIQHYIGVATLHGVLRIYKSRGFKSFLWVVLTIICAIVLIWQFVNLFIMYSAKPIVSQVSFLVTEQGMLFPKITICNFNPIRKSFVTKLNETGDFSISLFQYLLESNSDVQSIYGDANETRLKEDDDELAVYMMKHPQFTINGFFFFGGFNCEEVMKLCSFAGRSFNCCSYSTPVLTTLGRCQSINLQQADYEWMRKQTEEGVDSGLQVVLDTHLEQQYDGTQDDPNPVFTNDFENGFRFYVSEPDSSSYKTSQGMSVSPSDRIYSALSPTFYELLDKQHWGNCTSEWPSSYTGNVTRMKYSASDCVSKCKAIYYNDNCGCSPFVYNIDEEFRSCTPLETYECTKKYIVVNHNETAEEFIWPACKECQVECEKWEYNSANSYSSGFSNGALLWLNERNPNWTMPHIKSNFLTINVFFRDMSYTKYAQVQGFTTTQLLSDIGGNMGMFLGMSMLTCAEIVIFAWKMFWIAVSKSRRLHMLEKKRREEADRNETETTIRSLRQMNVSSIACMNARLANIDLEASATTKESVAERLMRWSRIPKISSAARFTESCNVEAEGAVKDKRSISLISHPSPSAHTTNRERFMQKYYDRMLYGEGRVERLSGSVEEESREGSVIEVDIDLDQLERQTNADCEACVQVNRQQSFVEVARVRRERSESERDPSNSKRDRARVLSESAVIVSRRGTREVSDARLLFVPISLGDKTAESEMRV